MDLPYIAFCKYCAENGLVRFWRCNSCGTVLGVCDECESGWKNIEALFKDNELDSEFVVTEKCPICGNDTCDGKFMISKDVEELHLGDFIKGVSP